MTISRTHTKHKGFTLTELLVVIFIMVILMGIGSLSIMQNNTGRGLNAGMSTLESAINEARSVAMSKGTRARMVINNDQADTSKYLRQIVTMFETDAGGWEPAFRSVSLPANVFFDPDQEVNVAGMGNLGTNSAGDFSRNYNPDDYYVEFNHLGICKIEGAMNSGATLALVSGRITGGNLVPSGKEKTGIVIWRNGSTTNVNDVNRIEDRP